MRISAPALRPALGKPLTDAVLRILVESEPPLYSVKLNVEVLPKLPDAHVSILEMVDHLYPCTGSVPPKEVVEAMAFEDFVQVLEVVAYEVHVVELVVVEHGAAAFPWLRQPFSFVNAVGGYEVSCCIQLIGGDVCGRSNPECGMGL